MYQGLVAFLLVVFLLLTLSKETEAQIQALLQGLESLSRKAVVSICSEWLQSWGSVLYTPTPLLYIL